MSHSDIKNYIGNKVSSKTIPINNLLLNNKENEYLLDISIKNILKGFNEKVELNKNNEQLRSFFLKSIFIINDGKEKTNVDHLMSPIKNGDKSYNNVMADALFIITLFNCKKEIKNWFINNKLDKNTSSLESLLSLTFFHDDVELFKMFKTKTNKEQFEKSLYQVFKKQYYLIEKNIYYPKNIINYLIDTNIKDVLNNLENIKNNRSHSTDFEKMIAGGFFENLFYAVNDYEGYYKIHKNLSKKHSFWLIKNKITACTKYNTTVKFRKIVAWEKSVHPNNNLSLHVFKVCFNPYTTPTLKEVMKKEILKKDLLYSFKTQKIDIGVDINKFNFVLENKGNIDQDALYNNLILKIKRVASNRKVSEYAEFLIRIEKTLPNLFNDIISKGNAIDILKSRQKHKNINNAKENASILENIYFKSLKKNKNGLSRNIL